jgi:hypothetical protein
MLQPLLTKFAWMRNRSYLASPKAAWTRAWHWLWLAARATSRQTAAKLDWIPGRFGQTVPSARVVAGLGGLLDRTRHDSNTPSATALSTGFGE